MASPNFEALTDMVSDYAEATGQDEMDVIADLYEAFAESDDIEIADAIGEMLGVDTETIQ